MSCRPPPPEDHRRDLMTGQRQPLIESLEFHLNALRAPGPDDPWHEGAAIE